MSRTLRIAGFGECPIERRQVKSGALYAALRAAKVGGCGIGGNRIRAEVIASSLDLFNSMIAGCCLCRASSSCAQQ